MDILLSLIFMFIVLIAFSTLTFISLLIFFGKYVDLVDQDELKDSPCAKFPYE